MIQVIPSACNACPENEYCVTDRCICLLYTSDMYGCFFIVYNNTIKQTRNTEKVWCIGGKSYEIQKSDSTGAFAVVAGDPDTDSRGRVWTEPGLSLIHI